MLGSALRAAVGIRLADSGCGSARRPGNEDSHGVPALESLGVPLDERSRHLVIYLVAMLAGACCPCC